MRPIKVDTGSPGGIIPSEKRIIPDGVEGGEALLDGVGRPRGLPVGISDAHCAGQFRLKQDQILE